MTRSGGGAAHCRSLCQSHWQHFVCGSADKLMPGGRKLGGLRYVGLGVRAARSSHVDIPCLVSVDVRRPERYELWVALLRCDSADLGSFSWNFKNSFTEPLDGFAQH